MSKKEETVDSGPKDAVRPVASLTNLSQSAVGGAGGVVDTEFKDKIERQFRDQSDVMEELKEELEELKKEIGHVRNDVAAKFAND